MAIAPNDPRHPDLTASDILSPQTWPRRGIRPAVGLDVICTKIAVDFQSMTAATMGGCIFANLELLREATRADTAFHLHLDGDLDSFADVQVARGMLATGNPEQLRGQKLEAFPWLRTRLAPLRVSEFRDTAKPRPDQIEDAVLWSELGIGSVLMIGYHIAGRAAGILGIASALPRENWDVQLHLLMKLVGCSLATGLERIEIQRTLSDLEERNELALYSANDGLWDFDTLNNRVYLSPRWKAMLGYDEPGMEQQTPDWRTLVHSDDMSRVQAAIRDHVAGKTPIFESLHRMRHATGEWRWVISRAKAKVDEKGRLLRLVGVELDITERKLYEDALFREKESAQITLQSIGDGVITTDAKGMIDYVNPVAETLTGWRLEDSQGRAIEEIFRAFHEETCEPLENPLAVAIRRTRSIKSVRPMLLIRRDGNEIYVESTASPIRDGSGAVSGGVLVFHDVSEARELNRRLSYHASHDVLTGLVNRREFESRMERALKSAKAHETSYALCYLDLDQFKIINDTCGHSAGDALLGQVGALLKSKVRWRDTLARLGGDEFGILLESCSLDEALRTAESLREAVRNFKFTWEERTFRLGASIGVVPISPENADVASVLSAADSACQAAKEAGRNRVHSFEENDIDLMRAAAKCNGRRASTMRSRKGASSCSGKPSCRCRRWRPAHITSCCCACAMRPARSWRRIISSRRRNATASPQVSIVGSSRMLFAGWCPRRTSARNSPCARSTCPGRVWATTSFCPTSSTNFIAAVWMPARFVSRSRRRRPSRASRKPTASFRRSRNWGASLHWTTLAPAYRHSDT
jgi:diguanylate cyclase (GGDEF)-like protein/PAS domain S-box-containing protein